MDNYMMAKGIEDEQIKLWGRETKVKTEKNLFTRLLNHLDINIEI